MPKITPQQLDIYASQMADLYQEMELAIFKKIAHTLKVKGTESVTEWQIRVFKEMGLVNDYTIKELKQVTGKSEKELREMFNKVKVASVDEVDDRLGYKDMVRPMTNVDMIMKAYQTQAILNINNYVNQSLITTNYGTGTVQQVYQDILNRTMAELNLGLITRDEALWRVMDEIVQKGLPTSFIDKGGRQWSVDSYIRTTLKSTLNSTYNEIRTERMGDYGIHTVVMTTLPDPAPRCSHCQGKVLDMREPSEADSGYPSIYDYGYGTAGGVLGANCRHNIIPFIPGVNTNNQKQYNTKEAEERYQVRQQQRANERAIRKTKKRLAVAQEIGVKDVERLNKLLRSQQARQRELLKGADWLRRDYSREKVR